MARLTGRDPIAYLLLGCVATAAAVISFDSLTGLARFTGIHPPWFLPLCVDAYAATGIRMWYRASSPRVRTHAKWNAFAAMAVSVVGNATYHGIIGGSHWGLAVAVGSVAPVMLWLAAHLHALDSAEQHAVTPQGHVPATAGSEAEPHPPASTGQVTEPVPAPPATSGRVPVRAARAPAAGTIRDRMWSYIDLQLAEGRALDDLTGRELDDRFGTKDRGRLELRNYRNHPPRTPVSSNGHGHA